MINFYRKFLTCFVVKLDDGSYWLFRNKVQLDLFFKTYLCRENVIALYKGYCSYYEKRGFRYFFVN